MSVYDRAHDLARALAKSSEYEEFKRIKDRAFADERNKAMLENFRRQQLEVQQAQFLGQELDEEKVRKVNELQQLLMLNPVIKEYLNAEMRFLTMVMDVQKIIGQAIDVQ